MIVLLWTDILLWLLVISMFFAVRYIRTQDHLMEPWKRVMKSKIARGSLMVLSVYLIVVMRDSMHFRPQLEGGE